MIRLYTDGAYNPGRRRGGWAAVVEADGEPENLSGWAENTSSNRMEIAAALEGIMRTPEGAEVTVFTDSQYVFGTMTQGWKRRANNDLWEKLDAAVAGRKVAWVWIEGTNNHPLHQRAHRLANEQAGLKAEAPHPDGELTHIDVEGRPRMVDVSAKPDTLREAVARGRVKMQPATLELILKGEVAKGDVLTVARIAGIMAAKRTPDMIPLCHLLLLDDIDVDLTPDSDKSVVEIKATVKSRGKTGVEMEALTAVMAAGLTVYDMCKAVDRAMRITDVRLVRKSGGKSGTIELEPE